MDSDAVEVVDIEEDAYMAKPVAVDRHWRVEEKKKKPFRPIRSTISALLRLFVWYSIFTALFRCPSSVFELDDQSPRVCKPYLVARTHLEPHIAPYYHKYGEHHVEKLQPYAQSVYDKAEKIYNPTARFLHGVYQGYVSVYVEQATELAKSQWNQRVSPHIDPLQKQATDYYVSSVDPHVRTAQSIAVPYIRVAAAQSIRIKDNYLIPSYISSRPVIERACAAVHNFIISTIAPYTRKAWSAVFVFLNGTVRTQITHLYSENVEPQLVKIGEKLASYREGRTIQHVNLETASPIVQVHTSADKPSTKSTTESKATRVSSVEPPASTKLTPAQQSELAREKISTDLKAWKERTEALAKKGCEHVQEQVRQEVENISNKQQSSGNTILGSLQFVVENQLISLKSDLYAIVQAIPEEYTEEDEQEAHDEFLQSLKESSLIIRENAHRLRLWFHEYQDTLTNAVTKTVNTTLDVLENTRELGLQEIGMRWTSIDGVTYKDWANFYDLKTKLGEWKDDIRQAGLQHDSFLAAKSAGDTIVARGMDIAQDAAQQLSELRSIGRLKIEARETSKSLDVEHIDEEMLRERRKYMITSVTFSPAATPSPSETSATSSVVESLEAEVETPQGDKDGQQPKAAVFDEQSTLLDEFLETEPSPEAPFIIEETSTEETPVESPANLPLTEEEPISLGVPGAAESYLDEVIDSIDKEQERLDVVHEQDTTEASQTSSSTASSISSPSPVFVTQKFDDAMLEDDDISSEASSAPESQDVHEIIGSATDEIVSLVGSAKTELAETPVPEDEANALLEDTSTQLDGVISSVQSSISSLQNLPPSSSATPEERREYFDSEIARLTAALEAAQAALLELNKPDSPDDPGQTQESAAPKAPDETTNE
ncbi:hypothetical protein MferCBS31731_004622 [Microsporum ferrugineum]